MGRPGVHCEEKLFSLETLLQRTLKFFERHASQLEARSAGNEICLYTSSIVNQDFSNAPEVLTFFDPYCEQSPVNGLIHCYQNGNQINYTSL